MRNGSQVVTLGNSFAQVTASLVLSAQGSAMYFYNQGDTLSFRAASDVNTTLDAFNASITRVSGPQAIAATETIGALYTGAPPTGTLNSSFNTITFGTKVKDSHGAYLSGSYTISSSGQYNINSQVAISANFTANNNAAVSIFIDGVEAYTGICRVTASGTTSIFPSINVNSIPLIAGQIITIRCLTDGATPSFLSNGKLNFFSITRSGNY